MTEFLKEPELILALLNGMQDGLTILDTDGALLYVNDAFCNMVQYSRAELRGLKPPFPYWHHDLGDKFAAGMQATLAGIVTSFEVTYQRKDGTLLDVLIAPAGFRSADGRTHVIVSTIKDISERKRLGQSLIASEQRWRSIAENPFDFVVLMDRNYRYTYVNHTAPGITEESLIGRATPFDFVDAKYHEVMRAAFDETLATGKSTSYEVYSGALQSWFSSIVGAVVEDGKVIALSVMSRNITSQKRAEEALERTATRLRDSHRIETVGRLAGGIAHDLNNMLTPILGYVDLAKRALPRDHAAQNYLDGVSVASHRARELVQRVLLFSRRQEPQRTAIDLRTCIEEDLILLKASLPAGIELATEFCARPIPVFADRGQLSQVMTNLVTNAVQAMQSSGGTLALRLAIDEAGDRAIIEVSDTGCGMDEITMRRAFEPYFTTKAVGSGTGLGLSITQSVIAEHQGEVSITSAVGQGTTVTMRLPLGQSGITEMRTPEQTPNAAARATALHARVLVVDDEGAILDLVQEILSNAGYEVRLVQSAESALDLIRLQPADIDVLLTDHSMPGMTGIQLIQKARAICPSLPCLMMTGLFNEPLRRDAYTAGVLDVITKPFDCDMLLEAVARALTKSS